MLSWICCSFIFRLLQCKCCLYNWDALRRLVSFVQFEKRGNHPWRSVTFSNTPPWVFLTFLNCTNETKRRKVSQLFFTLVDELLWRFSHEVSCNPLLEYYPYISCIHQKRQSFGQFDQNFGVYFDESGFKDISWRYSWWTRGKIIN